MIFGIHEKPSQIAVFLFLCWVGGLNAVDRRMRWHEESLVLINVIQKEQFLFYRNTSYNMKQAEKNVVCCIHFCVKGNKKNIRKFKLIIKLYSTDDYARWLLIFETVVLHLIRKLYFDRINNNTKYLLPTYYHFLRK